MASQTRRGRARAAALAGACTVLVVATAGPALAHASFPQSSNSAGSTGAPLPAGSTQTLKMAVPFEQDGVLFNGLDNTVVNVEITAPTGWAGAGCGEARKTDLSAVVSGWTCAVTTASSRQVLKWSGAQVAAGKTAEDSAQYFTFTIKTPSPATATGYGAAGSSADGFRVVQKYADGATSTWRTPNDTGTGEVANGLVRHVAAAGGGASPAPSPSPSATPKVTAAATPEPTPTPSPSADSDDEDDLPQTGGRSDSGALLIGASSTLALGLVLVAWTTKPRRREQNR